MKKIGTVKKKMFCNPVFVNLKVIMVKSSQYNEHDAQH